MSRPLALISTGTELLRGRSLDTHLSLIAREVEPLGLEVGYHSTCPDDLDRLVEEIRLTAARADIVILTGGLGPTEDDYTRRAAAEAFERPLEFSARAWRAIRARFRKFRIPMAANNRRQAFLPRGARLLPNPLGSAPGFKLAVAGTRFFALPGPPREMIPMLRRLVLPALSRLGKPFKLWEATVYGMPEGTVDEIVAPIVRRVGASYGITVSGGLIRLAVKRADGSPAAIGRKLTRALGIHLVGPGNLEQTVAEALLKKRRTIAVAESCTGGQIADRLTNCAGISASLLEGWVCYSNASKTARLGVPAELIRRHGAVSAEVAAAMAEGAARSAGADIGVATTGIAGPSGGSREKPVGLVWHAVHYRNRTRVERRVFPGDRAAVKGRAANLALDLVRRALLE
ncbi:MAG TPA: CinA family nicotinamide mononucleotide deamidase-related protein [Candidatus Eisenbacteria bacterium]|nr:CinA family nicotinamide mononucleotide deamidase-related protein [Candidatus Eisenbacteria bacterium]